MPIFNRQFSLLMQPVSNGAHHWFGYTGDTAQFPGIVDIQQVLVRCQWLCLVSCLVIEAQCQVHLIRGVPIGSLIQSRICYDTAVHFCTGQTISLLITCVISNFHFPATRPVRSYELVVERFSQTQRVWVYCFT